MTLHEHLEELKALYESIPARLSLNKASMDAISNALTTKNSMYPNEGFEAFVARLITIKKLAIESLVKEPHL